MGILGIAATLLALSAAEAGCYDAVLVCRERGDAVVCRKRYVPRGGPASLAPSRNLPRTSDLRVPYDDGSGVEQRDPATLIGKRVRMRFVGGSERWVKVVDIDMDVVVVNYRGSEWSYAPEQIELVAPLHD